MAVTAALLTGYLLLPVHDATPFPAWVDATVTIAIVIVAVAMAWRSVLRAEFPILRATETVAVVVTVTILGYAASYAALSHTDDAAFSESLDQVDALYLAVATATTVGFGDIAARSNAARILVMAQMITSIAVVGLAIRMLFNAARQRAVESADTV